jgi:putative acyl-CoA dehydrogenase
VVPPAHGAPRDPVGPVGGGTHEVTNQPPPLEGYNLFETDRPLAEAVRREGASWSATVPGRTER